MIRIIHGDHAGATSHPPTATHLGVQDILQDVRDRGDEALREYEDRFSGYDGPLQVSAEDIRHAYQSTPKNVIDAISKMIDLIQETEQSLLDSLNGAPAPLGMDRSFQPIPSIGCYVPGGLARYPSSAVMSVVPASVADVQRIVVVTPPSNSDSDVATIVSADMAGAHEIYRTGGAQAIAALAYGTKSIPRVDKIVGPGGSIVTAAKRIVSADVPIDMAAGPTELGIIADDTADPRIIALDLISQSEHSPDTFCFMLTNSVDLAHRVAEVIESRLDTVQRSDIVRESLCQNGFLAVYDTIELAISAAERLAPEHLQVITKDPKKDSTHLNSPGLILLGQDTPSAASDYVLGSNHILPTNGQGRLRGPLSVLDCVKMRVAIHADSVQMAGILDNMYAITGMEGLPNHYEAVRGRLQ